MQVHFGISFSGKGTTPIIRDNGLSTRVMVKKISINKEIGLLKTSQDINVSGEITPLTQKDPPQRFSLTVIEKNNTPDTATLYINHLSPTEENMIHPNKECQKDGGTLIHLNYNRQQGSWAINPESETDAHGIIKEKFLPFMLQQILSVTELLKQAMSNGKLPGAVSYKIKK